MSGFHRNVFLLFLIVLFIMIAKAEHIDVYNELGEGLVLLSIANPTVLILVLMYFANAVGQYGFDFDRNVSGNSIFFFMYFSMVLTNHFYQLYKNANSFNLQ